MGAFRKWERSLSVIVEGVTMWGGNYLSGFKPAIHVAPLALAVATASSDSPVVDNTKILPLTAEGVVWARKLMTDRPYFAEHWTITELEHA